ncbi:MAG: HD family phosphohydrolase [Desulfovibrio sp.]
MGDIFSQARGVCKTIMRNGYDAYIINARLQQEIMKENGEIEHIDISTEMTFDDLKKIYTNMETLDDSHIIGTMEEDGAKFNFYNAQVETSTYPEECVTRVTPLMLGYIEKSDTIPMGAVCTQMPKQQGYDDFGDIDDGHFSFKGIPDLALKKNYLLGVRALRFAANFNLEIEANSWNSIVRNSHRIVEYVPIADFIDEWRKVEPENMWRFLQFLFDSMLLHGLVPELAALSRLKETFSEDYKDVNLLEHTIEVMRRYPEELPFDWFGTVACMFHSVGKLYTSEFYDDDWHYYQHHRVGAKVTRKILSRLRFPQEDIDLICDLVRNHVRAKFMLTDRGIRRLKALDEYPRILEMIRAEIKAIDGSYREFNHILKMLDRADIPEDEIEPLMNGNEIMQVCELNPGPNVGIIRDALLTAQIEGKVNNIDGAKKFAIDYVKQHKMK